MIDQTAEHFGYNRQPAHPPHHNQLAYGIALWRATGHGIDPHQPALRHHPVEACRCHWCAGTPIVTTQPIAWPA